MTETAALTALVPVLILLFIGIVTVIGSRAVGLSPIVGYLALGLVLRASGLELVLDPSTISLLAELGVVFLLFDIGLHFTLGHVRKQASDIFAFGPVQVLFATFALGVIAWAFGMTPLTALLVGGVLSLSSTAVVARLIAERHQRNCPVGQTATAILIFQDVAAIFLLIVANSLSGGGSMWIASGLALLKALAAFGVTVLIARLLIGPILRLVAQSRNEEVFTATALLIALAAAWATGRVGLSLTLGAFLGGLMLAETPYRAVVESEIKPFRGLLLGFFFISIGLSLDVSALQQSYLLILVLTVVLLAAKVLTNILASRVFHWSVPGSTQLGFLLAQGSEFAFVILSLPAVRQMVGGSQSSILIAVVALSLVATPNLAEAGRKLAGRMRARAPVTDDPELTPRSAAAPVIIVGMGTVGRTVADGLIHFGFGYDAVEKDVRRLQLAIADGYHVTFGDAFDLRLWGPSDLRERKASVLTSPELEALTLTSKLAKANFPTLRRFAVAKDEAGAQPLRAIGLLPIVERGSPRGLDIARAVLAELGVPADAIAAWAKDQRSSSVRPTELVTAA